MHQWGVCMSPDHPVFTRCAPALDRSYIDPTFQCARAHSRSLCRMSHARTVDQVTVCEDTSDGGSLVGDMRVWTIATALNRATATVASSAPFRVATVSSNSAGAKRHDAHVLASTVFAAVAADGSPTRPRTAGECPAHVASFVAQLPSIPGTLDIAVRAAKQGRQRVPHEDLQRRRRQRRAVYRWAQCWGS